MTEPDAAAVSLAEARASARAEKDYAAADALRDELAAAGWTIVDQPDGGWRLEPVETEVPAAPLDPHDVTSLLDAAATDDVSTSVCTRSRWASASSWATMPPNDWPYWCARSTPSSSCYAIVSST